MLLGDGPKGNKFANAGVSENNIDSPFRVGDRLVETIKVGQFGHVSLNAGNVAADCLHGIVEFFLAAASAEDKRTLFHEELPLTKLLPVCAFGDDSDLPAGTMPHSSRALQG